MGTLARYAYWHYAIAPRRIMETFRNLFSFGARVFAIRWHARTLFAPWYMDKVAYRGGFLSGEFFMTLMANGVTRVLGAIPRAFVVFTGLLFELAVVLFGATVLAGWVLYPLLMPALLFAGILLAL